ncbi:MAG: hypothetical protein CL816_04135 [Coxiellaceae bacterium]|nr:hypothetical protein [Coxiellaceae bacterium]|tara:strand:+ start:2238 stop:2603 length:366 start_codon:yes stop_codon:yes gene_type:complete
MKPWIRQSALAGIFLLSANLTTLAASEVACPTDKDQLANLSMKEQIQCQIKGNTQQQVSEQVKQALSTCRASLDDSQCQKDHPFRILKKQDSINALSLCISNTIIRCVGEKLAPRTPCPTK